MIRNQILIRKGEYWEMAHSFDQAEIPVTLTALIHQRLDQLYFRVKEQEVLQILALLDRDISWEELSQITPTDFNFLKRLIQREIIVRQEKEGYIGYCIAHDLIRESIINRIQHKAILHNTLATSLEKIHNNDPEAYFDELAHHFYQGQNREKAREYLDKAGEKAKNMFENQKALALFDTLLPLLNDSEVNKKVEIFLKRGWVYWIMGNLPQSIQENKKAGELAESIQDLPRAAEAFWMCSHALLEMENKSGGIVAHRALQLAEKANNIKFTARILNVLGTYYRKIIKNHELAVEHLQRGIIIAREGHDLYGIYINMLNLSWVYQSQGSTQKAIELLDKALHLGRNTSECQRDQALGYNMMGSYYTSLQKYEIALDYFEKSVILCDQVGCLGVKIYTLIQKSEALFYLQDFHQAQQVIESIWHDFDDKHKQPVISLLNVLVAKVSFALHNEKGKQDLIDMLKTTEVPDEIAHLNYELWCMSRDESYRNTAQKIYEELTTKAFDHIYKTRLQHLKKNNPPLIYPHQDRGSRLIKRREIIRRASSRQWRI